MSSSSKTSRFFPACTSSLTITTSPYLPVYTFQGSNAITRVAKQLIVADTSYLIALSDPQEKYYNSVVDFHQAALQNEARFIINVVIRQEFLKQLRKVQLIQAMLNMANSEPLIADRYRQVLGQNAPLTAKNLRYRYEDLYKDHVQKNDNLLLKQIQNTKVWEEAVRLENEAKMLYVGGGGNVSWDDLGDLMADTGLSPTDAMIVNFAFSVNATALVTTDCDFAQVADAIDVYMPPPVADSCAVYDLTLD